MGIDAEVERAINFLYLAIVTDGLSDRQYVPLVERHVGCGSAMAGSAKRDQLSCVARVGAQLIIIRGELRDVHQD
jgi:uncharacterized protein (UPF0264 family)